MTSRDTDGWLANRDVTWPGVFRARRAHASDSEGRKSTRAPHSAGREPRLRAIGRNRVLADENQSTFYGRLAYRDVTWPGVVRGRQRRRPPQEAEHRRACRNRRADSRGYGQLGRAELSSRRNQETRKSELRETARWVMGACEALSYALEQPEVAVRRCPKIATWSVAPALGTVHLHARPLAASTTHLRCRSPPRESGNRSFPRFPPAFHATAPRAHRREPGGK